MPSAKPTSTVLLRHTDSTWRLPTADNVEQLHAKENLHKFFRQILLFNVRQPFYYWRLAWWQVTATLMNYPTFPDEGNETDSQCVSRMNSDLTSDWEMTVTYKY